MTKTDWTAEEVRDTSVWLMAAIDMEDDPDQRRGLIRAKEMLTAFATRIAADESAVPEVPDGMWKIGKLIECLSDIKERFGNTCVWMEECKWGASALHAKADHDEFEASNTRPPAQPAQEHPGWKVPNVFAKLYEAASKGFHMSESCGPESLYMHKSKFPTLQDLFDFEDAWRKAMLSASPAPPKEN